jgi:hypothetical protein
LFIAPRGNDIGAIADNDVDVVGHDGVGQNIQTITGRDFFHALLYPSTTVFEGLASERVLSTQPSTSHGALHAVINPNFMGIKKIASILSSHERIPPNVRSLEDDD